MKLKVNGEALEIDHPVSVRELLVIAKASQPEYVTVQLNGDFVNQGEFDRTTVNDGDEIEFLYFMGGGCNE